MFLKKILIRLSPGELKKYIEAQQLIFCEFFLKKDISDNNAILVNIAFQNIKYYFHHDADLRKKTVESATLDELSIILERASEFIKFDENAKKAFNTNEAYILTENVFNSYYENEELINYILGLSNNHIEKTIKKNTNVIQEIKPKYPLYPYQLNITNELKKKFTSEDRCMLHLPTGAGKTRTSINYACDFLRNNNTSLVLWLANRNELCEQAHTEFCRAWNYIGNSELKAYSYFGEKGNFSLAGIKQGFLVCSVQSLWALKKSSNRSILYDLLAKEVDLVIFDEAHQAIAGTYREIIEYILENGKNTKLLGLSATPGRVFSEEVNSNDENTELASLFSENKVTMQISGYLSPIHFLFEKNYLATPEFKNIEYTEHPIIASLSNNLSIKDAASALSKDQARNQAILNCIIEETKNNSYIIVFANNVNHAKNLSALFLAFNINAACVHSDSKDRNNIIRSYRKKEIQVIVNYDILTAGFDAPHTNVALIARPTTSLVSYSQMAGRAMRGGENGNKTCTIYTVNDHIPEFRSVAKSFIHWDKYWK